jgi:DNA-binding CsgD family transcriptional regulator
MRTKPLENALTPTEGRVLALIGEGKTSKEIASVLNISVLTVGNHRKSLCHKLNVHSTAALAVLAPATVLTGFVPRLGTPCVVVLQWERNQSTLHVVHRGRLTNRGGPATVSIGTLSFSF